MAMTEGAEEEAIVIHTTPMFVFWLLHVEQQYNMTTTPIGRGSDGSGARVQCYRRGIDKTDPSIVNVN